MTVEAAVQKLRELQWAADEGWPLGFDEDEVPRQAVEAIDTLEAYADGQPPDERQDVARRLLARLESKTYEATVSPRTARRSA